MRKRTVSSFQMTEADARKFDALEQAGFGTRTDVIRTALDRMYIQEIKIMNTKLTEQQALQMAEEAIEYADTEGHLIGGTLFVGIDLVGKFWVTDNGEEVSGLTEQGAIDIIAENLLATKDE